YPWRLEVTLRRGIYDFVLPFVMVEIPEDAMLDLEGNIQFWGNRKQYSGVLNLNALTVGMYGYTFSNPTPVRVAIEEANIMIEQFQLKSGTATFEISGSLVPLKSFDITVHGEAFLTPIRRFFKDIETIKGEGSFVFSIRGDWNEPIINGGISLEDCSIGIKDFSYRLYDVKSYIYVDSNTVVMESFSGKVGGGDVSMKGFGYFKGLSIERFYVDMYLSDVSFKLTRGFLIEINGNIVYHGEKEKHSLVGQVNLKRARYTDRFDLRSQILKVKRPVKQKGSISKLEATELNIKIDGRNDIVISNNIAKTGLKVDLLLRGTIARPVLFGRVETEKGSIYFRNNEFDIVKGSMDFIGEEKINPYFDVSATTSVKGYNIRITVEGQLDQFNLSLVSDPPLDDADILALLTMGQLGSSEKGVEGGVGTAEATSFLSAAYQDVIEERLTSITGFDRFQVEPYLSEQTGTVAPRLIVAKRLIGDKLFLTYASSVGTGESDVIKIEYQVDRHVSLVGSQDDRGSLGTDIKFRFEFK
ncbi:MAG: translocation/assembly module TamB domain-containing protein, partial [bacterium]